MLTPLRLVHLCLQIRVASVNVMGRGPWSPWSAPVSTAITLPIPLWAEILLLAVLVLVLLALFVLDSKNNKAEVRPFRDLPSQLVRQCIPP